MPNPFIHIQLQTDDTKAAKAFYKKIFKWSMSDMKFGPDMVYTMIEAGEETGGGITKKAMPDTKAAWLPHVEVADVKKTLAKAAAAGAKIVADYMEIPGGMGAFGVFIDPTGAALGVWEEAKRTPAKKAGKRRAAKKK